MAARTFAIDELLIANNVDAGTFLVNGLLYESEFPTEFAGLFIKKTSGTIELSIVNVAEAPAGMGGTLKIDDSGTVRAIYLVKTTSPDASPVRIQTSTGIKAIRLKS